jgi:hypothetical protein
LLYLIIGFAGEDRINRSLAIILAAFIFSVTVLAGCTTENHRVMVTVKNLRDVSQDIQVHIDGENEFSASVGPGASVEKEFELSLGEHTFDLYQEVNGSFELYKTQTIDLESDSSVFFELE